MVSVYLNLNEESLVTRRKKSIYLGVHIKNDKSDYELPGGRGGYAKMIGHCHSISNYLYR